MASMAAERRLAKGLKIGDFVLYGDATVKVQAPIGKEWLAASKSGRTHCQTVVQSLGQISDITPTGLLTVVRCGGYRNGQDFRLDAKTSGKVEKIEGEALRRREA